MEKKKAKEPAAPKTNDFMTDLFKSITRRRNHMAGMAYRNSQIFYNNFIDERNVNVSDAINSRPHLLSRLL